MISRLYANNFRCLVAFEATFKPFTVLCGPNGAGKSSVFDALFLVRSLATGDSALGPGGVNSLEFTNWIDRATDEVRIGIQEFEIDFSVDGHEFGYMLHIEQAANELSPRIIRERGTCDRRELFDRDLEGVRFHKATGIQKGFPLDWRQAALGSIQPAADRREIELLQRAMAELLILRPIPHPIEAESKGESPRPDRYLQNLPSWFRSLYQEQEWIDDLRDTLRGVWPDFVAFRLIDVGLQTKALQLRFDSTLGRDAGTLFFSQLSDGEKILVALYMLRSALATGAVRTALVDEPDNFVGLPELQPWLVSVIELLDDSNQAILISHNAEILGNAGEDCGRYMWRDNHT